MKIQRSFLILIPILLQFVSGVYPQTTPPTVAFTTPPGLQRGSTVTVIIEGTDLTGARAIVFSEPGLSGRILSINEVPKEKWVSEAKPTSGVKPYFEEPTRMEA